jgi:hypothetical protein
MPGLASYLLAGILVMLVLDFIAPLPGQVMATGAQPAAVRAVPDQIVNRALKGDRLPLPTEIGRQQKLQNPHGVMVGCELPFSPLSTSARVNVSGRCVA